MHKSIIRFIIIIPLVWTIASFNQDKEKTQPQQTRVEDINESYLVKRLRKNDKRYKTFLLSMQIMKQHKSKILVETGTARYGGKNCKGDGCSTLIFGEWARDNDARLYSVDIDPKAIQNAKRTLLPLNPDVIFITSDSIAFLKNFHKYNDKIDFLYLDSFDFDPDNPGPSENHHLKEIKAAYKYLHRNSIVMVDDTYGAQGGKGRLVIGYLLGKGWKIAKSAYQVILVYKGQEGLLKDLNFRSRPP
jgi:predicted O-methyltransferase YrrM